MSQSSQQFMKQVLVVLFLFTPVFAAAQSASSDTFDSRITYEELRYFGDLSIDEVLIRMYGVSAGHRGHLNLRGVGQNRYSVTIDGQRVASTGLGDRSFDISTLSTEMVRDLEWKRFLTADMDHNALGGTINLRTNRNLVSARELSVRAGAGANPDYNSLTGTIGQLAIQYAEPLRDDLTLAINLSYQQDMSGWEGLQNEYASRDFGNGLVDLMEQVTPFVETTESNRIGGSLNLHFQPNNDQFYFLRAFLNVEDREFVQHQSRWLSNNSWTNQNTTGNQGRFRYNLNSTDRSIQTYAVHAGGRNAIDIVQLDYSMGWTHTTNESTAYLFSFEALNMPHSVDFDDRTRPVVEPVNNSPTRQTMRLLPMNFIADRHLDTRFSGNVDITIPLSPVTIKVGSNATLSHKNANDSGAFSHFEYNSRTLQTLNDFEELRLRNFSVLNDTYDIPWLTNAESAKSFMNSNVPAFATNEQVNRRLSDIYNYGAFEDVYSGYGMLEADLGQLQLYAGIRIEQTEAKYEGRVVRFDRFNRYVSTSDTSETASYTNVLPSVSAVYKLTDNTSAGVSFGRTIQRHDYNILAPYQLISAVDTSLFRGNHDLKPITSDNVDFVLSHQFSSANRVHVGAFYKSLQNYISLQDELVIFTEGEEQVFDFIFDENPNVTQIEARQRQYRNNDDATTIYGVEAGFAHRLTFLPGALRGLGIAANYTYMFTELENSRDEAVILQNYSPNTVNVSIDYTRSRFFVQIAYQWADEVLTNRQADQRIAPSINAEDPVYFDKYSDGWSDLSLSASINFSQRVSLWLNAYNLLGTEQSQYNYDRSLYPSGTLKRIDRGIMAGIQFNL